jgi:SNF2-related domain/Helicase conserved C-terminal domain/SWIM zinc finger
LAASSDVNGFDLSEVEAVVGTRSFQRGRAFARSGRVREIAWDADDETLTGSVVGNGGLYEATAFFASEPDGVLTFGEGECTCPVGYDCKHVAALVIAASTHGLAFHSAGRARPQPAAAPAPSWEEPLLALAQAPRTHTTGDPLAIELALRMSGVAGQGAPRLMARLMRPGARGGWVNGSLAWDALDPWRVQGYRPDHVALVRELHAVQRASSPGSYYYGYGADKTLDLSDGDSTQLWSLLDEAERIGVGLVHARKGLGEVAWPQQGELVLDVTGGGGGAVVTPAIRVDGGPVRDLEPMLFLGASGRGLVCVNARAGCAREDRELRLLRLLGSTPAPLQRMVLDGAQVRVPAGELQRFADELCPALRGAAPVVSSDGSFTPPEISAPALVLRASYGEGHAVQLGWEWAYRIGAATRRATLHVNGPPGFRDLDAERAILADTVLAGTGLERFGLLDDEGRPADAPASTAGIDSMRVTTELLPRLEQHSDVCVEVVGEPADYRDVSDAVTIGVSTVEIEGERDWFDLGVTISVGGRELPFAEVFAALAGGASHLLLGDGTYFSLQTPPLQSLRALIEEARALTDAAPAELRISRYQASLWGELLALGVVTEQARAWQRHVGMLLEFDGLPEHEPPQALAARLRPYQRDGFGWLATMWDLDLGGILADDMGLGKTLQTLALILHARDRDADVGPFLIVAPTSVVSNWVTEAARFAPQLTVAAISDTLAKSGRAIGDVAAGDAVVTTYTLLRLEADAYRSVDWAGVILDEAQYVKNHQAKTYRCVRGLAAPFKLALTGTPMENNLMELWSLLSIAAPGLFPDPKRFSEHYARPIERGGDSERLARLRRRIKPLVKRRTKELVAADLPAKQEQTLDVELHPRHRKLYDTHLQRERQKILGMLDDFDRNRVTILRSITLLRQLSLHPGLVDDDHGAVPCAKLGALVEQLGDVIGGGHRALVFSQFTGFLAKVRERLDHDGIGYCYLDGSTRKRDRVLEQFRDGDDPAFLISLKAGGFGLNLTEADYCFLLDPWWNPATEAQAIDRTHRIGQTRPVMVYRLIARDTIEEKVVALAQRKAKLFRGVMDDGDLFASSITAEDIRGLLG